MKIPLTIDGQGFLLQSIDINTTNEQIEVTVKAQTSHWIPKVATVILYLPNHTQSQIYTE